MTGPRQQRPAPLAGVRVIAIEQFGAGPFGTLLTGAIINQPQVAILSTDGVKKRPVAIELPDGSDGIAVHPTGLLAINFDHRAIDGAYAAAFLAKVKEILETRDWAAELG